MNITHINICVSVEGENMGVRACKNASIDMGASSTNVNPILVNVDADSIAEKAREMILQAIADVKQAKS